MKGSRGAIRYAKAMFSLAQDNNKLEVVNNDMLLFAKTIEENTELSQLIASPVVKDSIKKNALIAIFEGKVDAQSLELINILINNRRLNLIEGVAHKYTEFYEESKGVVVAKVITAVELTPSLEGKILDKVKELVGKEAVIESTVDASIIGGFILRVGDMEYNDSVINKLNKLKVEFSKN